VEQQGKKPSVFLGALIGTAIVGAIGVLITAGLTIKAGHASATGSLEIILSAEALGAYLGYVRTVNRRKALGINETVDDWQKLMASGSTFVPIIGGLALIIITTSFGLAVLIKAVYDRL
jgi:uncharacterized YccA/Bax inhibitor family protein